jgi:hypothetical protein
MEVDIRILSDGAAQFFDLFLEVSFCSFLVKVDYRGLVSIRE